MVVVAVRVGDGGSSGGSAGVGCGGHGGGTRMKLNHTSYCDSSHCKVNMN